MLLLMTSLDDRCANRALGILIGKSNLLILLEYGHPAKPETRIGVGHAQ